MAKYTARQAASKAKQIHDRFGQRIADVCVGSYVPADFLGGFCGVEAGVDDTGQIDETATRFEPGVFHHLQLVRNGMAHVWSKITTADLAGMSDDALRNLATSYGLTQIMGWHMIHDLQGSIADLRDPDKHLAYAVQLLTIDGGAYLRRGDLSAVLHIWNSGTPTGRTYDPDYVTNALAVKAAYTQIEAISPTTDSAAASPTTGPELSTEDAPANTQPAGVSTSTDQPPPNTLSTVGNKFDDLAGKASIWQGRADSVKALWSHIAHFLFQPIWAVLSLKVLGLPSYAWLGVAGFVFGAYALYHWRQLVLGEIRDKAEWLQSKC